MVTRIAIENVTAIENENESETRTESATVTVTCTATRGGTTSVTGTANAIEIVAIVIVIVTEIGTYAALGTITVQMIMIYTPATMDIWSGTKIETATIGLPSTLATSEMGGMTDGGLAEAQETMGMGVGMMKRRLMETKTKMGIRDGKNANEAKMWDAIYRNMKTEGIARGPRRYVN